MKKHRGRKLGILIGGIAFLVILGPLLYLLGFVSGKVAGKLAASSIALVMMARGVYCIYKGEVTFGRVITGTVKRSEHPVFFWLLAITYLLFWPALLYWIINL